MSWIWTVSEGIFLNRSSAYQGGDRRRMTAAQLIDIIFIALVLGGVVFVARWLYLRRRKKINRRRLPPR